MEWIKVAERLPEEGQPVLVVENNWVTCKSYRSDKSTVGGLEWANNVTHWMPFPEPPAKEE